MENINFEKKNLNETGWENETAKLSESIRDFISSNYGSNEKYVKNSYDSITELHLAGGSDDVLSQATEGKITPSKVEVYYENKKPIKIKVIYDGQNKGNDSDFYIQGRALEDFLNKQNK